MKRILSLCLVLLMCFALLPKAIAEESSVFSNIHRDKQKQSKKDTSDLSNSESEQNSGDTIIPKATYGWCGPNLEWQYWEGLALVSGEGYQDVSTLNIHGQGPMYNYSLSDRPPWEGYGFWSYNRRYLTIQNGATTIGNYAFTGLEAKINLPNSIESIGDYALSGCTSQKFDLGSKLTAIGTGAFKDCKKLEYVSIPNSVTSIGEELFYGCSSLEEVWLPSGMQQIPKSTFENCTSLESITLPGSVVSIGNRAFYDCSGLKSITINDNVTNISSDAFYGCTALTDVYYNGTRTDRYNKLTTALGNDCLNNATWHYITKEIDGMLQWNSEDVKYKGTTPYVIANGKAQTPRFTVMDDDGYPISSDNYDFVFRENKNAGTAYLFITFKNDYCGSFVATFKIYLPATEHTYVENVSNGIKVTWDPVEGAAGYVIYRRAWSSTTNGWTTFERWNNTTGTTYIDGADDNHKVYAGTRYQYGVKAYFAQRTDPVSGATIGGNVGDNYNLGEVGPLKTTVRITTRKLVQVRPGSKQMTVKWEASKNFTGYQIQYATNSAFTQNAKAIKISDPTTYWTTIKNLKSNTTYYVRIRSYHEFNGMTYFGEWSNVLSGKVN